MTWLGKSLSVLLYGSMAAVSAWVAYRITQERFQWELNALAVRDDQQDKRLDAADAQQRFLERQIMDKLTIMHGDIRKIEGKLER